MKWWAAVTTSAIAVIAMALMLGFAQVIALGAMAAIGYATLVSKLFDLEDGHNRLASVFHIIVALAIFVGVSWLVFSLTGTYRRFAG